MDQTLPLQTRVDKMATLPLHEAIQALLDLTTHLTTSLSPEGQRLVTHPEYTDSADLNHLARFYLQCGQRCTDEHAPFHLRLDYLALDPIFYAFYEQTDNAINGALQTGTLSQPYPEFEGGCCAHCSGEPAAVIPAGFVDAESMFFEIDEYRAYWGNTEARGERIPGPDSGLKRVCMASREQVEDAMRRLQQPN